MKREDVIVALDSCGVFMYTPKSPGSCQMIQCSIEKINDFAKLVEQATLEKAAKHFADHNYGEFYRHEVAAELRLIKESND